MCIYVHACLSAFQLLNKLTIFHKVWYEHCTIGGCLNLNLLMSHLVITVGQTHELVRWGVTLATLNSPGLMHGDRSMQNMKLYEIKLFVESKTTKSHLHAIHICLLV